MELTNIWNFFNFVSISFIHTHQRVRSAYLHARSGRKKRFRPFQLVLTSSIGRCSHSQKTTKHFFYSSLSLSISCMIGSLLYLWPFHSIEFMNQLFFFARKSVSVTETIEETIKVDITIAREQGEDEGVDDDE